MGKDFESTRRELKAKLSEFLVDAGVKISSQGKLVCLNPDHEERNPSMSILKLSDGTQIAHCFTCKANMDIFSANYVLTGAPVLGYEFITQNLKPLADKFDIEFEPRPMTQEEIDQMNIRSAMNIVKNTITMTLLKNGISENVEKYMKDKDLDRQADTINYNLGIVHDWNMFIKHLYAQGLDEEILRRINIEPRIFNDSSLIFTVCDEYGNPKGFAARNCDFNAENNTGSKYYNSKASDIYVKGSILYNLNRALKRTVDKHNSLYIVEGYTDAIALDKIGLRAAALSGSALTNDHIALLQKVGITDIVLLLDGDKAGTKATGDALTKLMEGIRNFRVRIVLLPDGEDPDSFVIKYGKDSLLSLEHISTFQWRLKELRERTDLTEYEIINRVIPLIINERSFIERDKMCKQLSSITNVAIEVIRKEIAMIDDDKKNKTKEEKQAVMDNLIKQIKKSDTSDALTVLHDALTSIKSISERNDEYIYDEKECYAHLEFLESFQENEQNRDSLYFRRMPRFERFIDGDIKGKLLLFGAEPNAGKCLSADSKILLPTGELKTVESVVSQKLPVMTFDEDTMKIVPTQVDSYWKNGIKEVFKVTTFTGRSIKITNNHPLLTESGWKELKDIPVGSRIAAPKRLTLNLPEYDIQDDELRLLGYLIADGGTTGTSYMFSKKDPATLTDFRRIVEGIGDTLTNIPGTYDYKITHDSRKTGSGTKQIYEKYCGQGTLSKHKTLPDVVFKCSDRQISVFLNALYSCDGSIYKKENWYNIEYSSASEELIDGLQHLLLRFGIIARKRYKQVRGKFDAWLLNLANGTDVSWFIKQIGFVTDSQKHIKAKEAWTHIAGSETLGNRLTYINAKMVQERLQLFLDQNGNKVPGGKEQFPIRNIGRAIRRGTNLSPSVVRDVYELIKDEYLLTALESDVFYDEIVSIEPFGMVETYDLTIDRTHNFIANDIIAHNTSFFLNMIVDILTAHESTPEYDRRADDKRYNNVSILMHAVDDTRVDIFNRLISILVYDKYTRATINHCAAPYKYDGEQRALFVQARAEAFATAKSWIKEGRLVIKDATQGDTLTAATMMIQTMKERFSGRKVLYFLDNLYDLSDLGHIEDENKRLTMLSKACKNLTIREETTTFATVEYRKGSSGVGYQNLNERIKQSKALEYDANFICHLLNEMHTNPENTEMYFSEKTYHNDMVPIEARLPVITMRVSKNKISDFKGDSHHLFIPNRAIFRELHNNNLSALRPIVRERLGKIYATHQLSEASDVQEVSTVAA